MTPALPAARPARLEAVLLDAGGVLLDLDYKYLRRLLDARGVDVSVDELSRLEALARTEIERSVQLGGRTGEAWREYFRFILAHARVAPEHHDALIDTLWDAHARFGLWTVPIPGAVETVRALRRRGLRIGVVSNAEGRVEQDLRGAGFDGLLDVVVDSHVVGVEKPDPRIFEIALERLGVAPGEAVFLGDVPSVDIAGARRAGVFAVLLDRHDLYPTCDAPRLHSIADLQDWIEPR